MEKYRPSSGTVGMMFQERFCCRCKKDADSSCVIVLRSMLHDIDDPEYPTEWVKTKEQPPFPAWEIIDGMWVACTAFEVEDVTP